MQIPSAALCALSLFTLANVPLSHAQQQAKTWNLSAGGAYVINAETQIFASTDSALVPIGSRIDLNEDLGVDDRYISPRLSASYRFNETHQLSLNYFRLNLSGTKSTERDIQLGDILWEAGTEVDTKFNQHLIKFSYDYMFHDEGKVLLTLSPGIYFTDFNISLQASLKSGSNGDIQEKSTGQQLTQLAPLPLLGATILYRVNDKSSVIFSSDWFFLKVDAYKGSLSDAHLTYHHQTFERTGFGIGLNRYSLNAEVDDDILWDVENTFTGVYAFVDFKI